MQQKKYSIYIALLCLFFVITPRAQAQDRFEDSLLRLYRKTSVDSSQARYLLQIGHHYRNSNPVKAEEYLTKAWNAPVKNEKKKTELHAAIATRMIRVEQMNNKYDESETWLKRALALSLASGNTSARLFALEEASTGYTQLEQYDKAIDCALTAVRLCDSAGRPDDAIDSYNNLGYLYNRLPQYSKALFYYKEAERRILALKKPQATTLLNNYSGQATTYSDTKKPDSALYYTNLLYSLAKKEDMADAIAVALLQRGGALMELNRVKESARAAEEGIAISKKNEIDYLLASFYSLAAKAYAKLGLADTAEVYVKMSEALTDTTSDFIAERIDNYNVFAQVYALQGKYDKAYTYKDKAYQEYSAFKEKEMADQTARSEALFRNEEQQKEITLLSEINQKQKTIQWVIAGALVLAVLAAVFAWSSYRSKKKAAAILEKSNQEKEVFLKEIHHRVKNNLQIIISLLHMQFRDSDDERVAAGLRQAQERIKSMALVHNKLYETEEVVHVYLKEYIEDLSRAILSANNPEHKKISIDIEEKSTVHLSLDTAVSVGLILNELITNACKYAFRNRDTGHINIRIAQHDDQCRLVVSDNGVGMQQVPERPASIGLRLVRNLARQLGGSAEFTSAGGTMVTILFNGKTAA